MSSNKAASVKTPVRLFQKAPPASGAFWFLLFGNHIVKVSVACLQVRYLALSPGARIQHCCARYHPSGQRSKKLSGFLKKFGLLCSPEVRSAQGLRKLTHLCKLHNLHKLHKLFGAVGVGVGAAVRLGCIAFGHALQKLKQGRAIHLAQGQDASTDYLRFVDREVTRRSR